MTQGNAYVEERKGRERARKERENREERRNSKKAFFFIDFFQ